MVLRAGANQNTPWSTGLNEPRVFNGAIHYTPGGTPIVVAAWEPYGDGCYKWFHSFYETYLNPSTSFDLKNTTATTNALRLTFFGTGYKVGPFQNGTGAFFAPTAAATNLMLGNNTMGTVPTPFPIVYPSPGGPKMTSTLEVCDNGYISPASGNGAIAVPAISAFLVGGARWAPAWFDFDPSLGGQVNWEVDPSNKAIYVTWVNVPDVAAAATVNTMQVMFANNGDVEFRWRAMSLAIGGTNPCLVGWTPGGAVADPGIVDISALTGSFNTGPTDNPPLTLALGARPKLGTTLNFTTTNIPTGSLLGALLVGGIQFVPGLSLAPINMAGCYAHMDPATAASFALPITGTSAQVNFPLANSPTLSGVKVYCQSATVTPGYNPLGLLTSNGIRLVLGTL